MVDVLYILYYSLLGGRTAPEIVSWLEKSLGPVISELTTLEEVKAFVDKADVTVMGYFATKDSDEAKAYDATANAGIESIPFGMTFDADVIKAMEATVDSIVLYKKVS